LSVVCPSCHPTNSIIALMEHKAQTSGLASSFLQPPLGSWWKRQCSLLLALQTQYQSLKSLQVSNTSTSKQNHCAEFNNCWNYCSTTVLRPWYSTTCLKRHPQSGTGEFCWSKVLLPAGSGNSN